MLNEVLILESSALDSFKYAEVLNTVFGDRLPKRVSYRVQAQIEQIQDIGLDQRPSMVSLSKAREPTIGEILGNANI